MLLLLVGLLISVLGLLLVAAAVVRHVQRQRRAEKLREGEPTAREPNEPQDGGDKRSGGEA